MMNETRTPTANDLLPLVGAIYDASLDVTKWETALRLAAEVFDSGGANIAYLDPDIREVTFLSYWGFPDGYEQRLREIGWTEDPRIPYFMAHPNKTSHCRQTCSEEVLHSSRMYREILHPIGVEYAMATSLSDVSTIVGVARARHQGPFTVEDCAAFDLLLPHFRRAVQIHRSLATLDFQQGMVLSVLNSIPLAICVTDQAGQTMFSNDAAKAILETRDGIEVDGLGRLWPSDHDARETMRAAVFRVINLVVRGNENTPGEAIRLPRRAGRSPLLAVVAPLWSNVRRFGIGKLDRPLAAVFLTDPDHAPETPVETLQRLFGLTLGEAEVLRLLTTGRTVDEIAAALDIQTTTVRSHLASLFAKTDTRRQAELIQKVLTSPAWLAGRH